MNTTFSVCYSSFHAFGKKKTRATKKTRAIKYTNRKKLHKKKSVYSDY